VSGSASSRRRWKIEGDGTSPTQESARRALDVNARLMQNLQSRLRARC
jgi:hypothetical protein